MNLVRLLITYKLILAPKLKDRICNLKKYIS